MNFKDLVTYSFKYLIELGYQETYEENNVVGYVKDNFIIEITFEPVGYEVSASFILKNTYIRVDLQDIIDYFKIKGMGLYQIASLDKMNLGVEYLADIIKKVIREFDQNEETIVKKIYNTELETREKLLKEYYIETDLKEAEKFWKSKEYQKAKELYRKNIEYLSKVQSKRLEYIETNVI